MADNGGSASSNFTTAANFTNGASRVNGITASEITSKASFAETIVFTCIYSIVILCATCGNSVLIIVVWKTKTMRTTTNYLLANISMADLLTAVACIPFVIIKLLEHPTGTLGSVLCVLVTKNSLPSLTMIVSILTLGLLAVERYHALLRPMRHKLRLTESSVWYAIIGTWVTAFLSSLPLFVNTKFDELAVKCRFTFDGRIYWILAGITMLLVLITICYCYLKIIQGLYFQRIVRVDSMSTQGEDVRNKKRIIRLLISVTVAFAICFAPRMMYLFFAPYLEGKVNVGLFRRISYLLLIANSSVNPIIYCSQSSNYRMAVRKVLCMRFTQRRERQIGVALLHLPKRERHKDSQPSEGKKETL